ncbi:MAG: NAD(P)H-dependent oxidoreductase subunit E [Candidatus Marinimicrobia bacterium]|nr:NAD(P)H-dependent oxidoreductase subunit E [Candidatus Neomarinimicrobiota bacterium]MCH8068759.1 NAD(P)H-dependent oxidoreductase subunit E [Candidatus Neomarinimicrobiota bacterium]
MDSQETVRIIEKHNNKRSALISILEEIQASFGYLPQDALHIIGKKIGCSLVDIYGVATFYKSFYLEPRGKHLVLSCLGTACLSPARRDWSGVADRKEFILKKCW